MRRLSISPLDLSIVSGLLIKPPACVHRIVPSCAHVSRLSASKISKVPDGFYHNNSADSFPKPTMHATMINYAPITSNNIWNMFVTSAHATSKGLPSKSCPSLPYVQVPTSPHKSPQVPTSPHKSPQVSTNKGLCS